MGEDSMIKMFFVFFMSLGGYADAAPNTPGVIQRNAADTATVNRFLPVPTNNSLFVFNATTILPEMAEIGPGLVYSGGILSSTSGGFDGQYSSLTGIPSTFSSTWALVSGKPIFATVATSGAYVDLTGRPTLVSAFTNDANYVTASALTSGLATKFNQPTGTTAEYIRGDGSLATLPTTPARSFANPVRTLNSAFQISSTRDSFVVYTVDVSVTSLLLAGTSGRVFLEYADNVGMTTNLVTVNSTTNATGGVLNVTNLGPGNVTGMIPAGKFVRIRTQNVSGTPTFTFQQSQEVLL